MVTSVYIMYPQSGIKFSQLKKIFATFEEGCKLFKDVDSKFEEGKVIRVESGSIWLEVVLPILKSAFSDFVQYIFKKLSSKRSKNKFYVEKDEDGKISIIIED